MNGMEEGGRGEGEGEGETVAANSPSILSYSTSVMMFRGTK